MSYCHGNVFVEKEFDQLARRFAQVVNKVGGQWRTQAIRYFLKTLKLITDYKTEQVDWISKDRFLILSFHN